MGRTTARPVKFDNDRLIATPSYLESGQLRGRGRMPFKEPLLPGGGSCRLRRIRGHGSLCGQSVGQAGRGSQSPTDSERTMHVLSSIGSVNVF
jgi:hypothetical protein